ncbi:hypothetical protein Bca52824_064966 [Brassica carinata]|uniref:Uncharacterized protein n=1 Tax=Brassica carinata TaxID=52824 RepID=A0A8X7UBX7_BRACI|nr:hypothetical protein Bca52824_064966 [Brassica carinata]
MANLQLLLFELKAGRCKETIVTRLFRFLEARNVKKSGELMENNMGDDNNLGDGRPRVVTSKPSSNVTKVSLANEALLASCGVLGKATAASSVVYYEHVMWLVKAQPREQPSRT